MFRWPTQKTSLTYFFVSAQITVVFTVLYGFCNWLASQKKETYQLWMPWELNIPLVPWMILIYLSLYVLNLIPLFTLNSQQIRALGNSMLIATVIAALFFLGLPAHIGFTRTLDVGRWEPFFKFLFSMDLTANTFPSLHITYSYLLTKSVSTTHPKIKLILKIWFLLMCSSVLLVHQHHVIDIIGGLILAEFCYQKFFFKKII